MFHTLLVPVEFAADGVNSADGITATFIVARWGVTGKAALSRAVISAFRWITQLDCCLGTGAVPDVRTADGVFFTDCFATLCIVTTRGQVGEVAASCGSKPTPSQATLCGVANTD